MFQSITTGVGRYIELSVAKSRIPPLSCSGDNCEHTDHRGYHKSHPCGKVRFAADSALEEDGFKLSGSWSRDRQTVMGRPDGRLENGGGTVEEPKDPMGRAAMEWQLRRCIFSKECRDAPAE